MIYTGNRKSLLVKGDFHPAQLYIGSHKITGYELLQKKGTDLTFENTYNDTADLILYGLTDQEHPRIGVLEGSDLQFDDAESGYDLLVTADADCTVTRCGRSLLDNTLSDSSNSTRPCNIFPGTFYYRRFVPEGDENKYTTTIRYRSGNDWIPITPNGSSDEGNIITEGSMGWYQTRQKLTFKKNYTVFSVRESESVQLMLTTGSYAESYEPYRGAEYELTAGQPLRIPSLEGVNTVFADCNLHVEYRKKAAAEELPTDITAPVPQWPVPLGSVENPTITSTGENGEISTAAVSATLRGLEVLPTQSPNLIWTDENGTEHYAISDTYESGGTIIRRIGHKVFDGTEKFTLNIPFSDKFENLYFYYTFVPNKKSPFLKSGLCSHFKVLNAAISSVTGDGIYFELGTSAIYFIKAGCPTAASLKAWLAEQVEAGTPVTVDYILGEPTTEPCAPFSVPTFRDRTSIRSGPSLFTAKCKCF